MGLMLRLAAPAALMLCSVLSLVAQDRDVRAERLYLDDNNGEGITIIAPHPMPNGASYSLTLPDSLPSTPFVLFGNPSGAITAEEPSSALNTISWLISGNSSSNPANDFLGTTDSVALTFRTNGLERLRIDALGNVGIGTTSSGSARLHLMQTFDDSIPVDPLFSLPLAFGIRSEATSPSSVDSQGTYISTGSLMFLQGNNDLSTAGSFIGNVGLAVNSNTGGGVNEVTGSLGFVLQVDPGAAISGSITGVRGGTQISAGTVNEAVGVSGNANVEGASVARVSGLSTNIGVGSGGDVTNGYGLYVAGPYIDSAGVLTNFTGVHIDNLSDSGQIAIRYDGFGSNVPFVVEGDGDVGVGTSSPGEARLRIVKKFADTITTDPELEIPVTFGTRTDVTNPSTALPGGIYVGSATLSSIEGTSDMSSAGQFVGSAALVNNTNTGGTLNGMLGIVGQVIQREVGASAGFIGGIQGQAQVGAGTVNQVYGVGGSVEVGGTASVSGAVPLSAGLTITDSAAVTDGYGLVLQQPFVNADATLTNYTAIQVENLSDSGQVALRYNASGTNAPFILEGDGDVGVGTLSPGEARLRVVKTFADSVSNDPFFNEPLAFGTRTDVTNPAVPDSAAVYVSAGSIAFVEGGNDMSNAETFVGGAALSVNTNTGGTVPALFGMVGQSVQRAPAASSNLMLGTLGSVQLEGGTVNTAMGLMGTVEGQGGTVSTAMGIIARIELSGSAAITDGRGLYISEPVLNDAAAMTSFTGLHIDNLSGAGYTAFRYDGTGLNAPFIIEGDGDVGVGKNAPAARLDVENGDSAVATLALNNTHAEGIALQVNSGGVVLSYGSGAPATIPTGAAVFEVNDGTGASAPVVGVPLGGSNGQILYVYISDPDGATVGGNSYGVGDRITYIYVAGAWQVFHVN